MGAVSFDSEKILNIIYEEVLYSDSALISLNSKISGMTREAVELHVSGTGGDKQEALSDSITKIAADAQSGGYKAGFMQGFRLASEIFLEN